MGCVRLPYLFLGRAEIGTVASRSTMNRPSSTPRARPFPVSGRAARLAAVFTAPTVSAVLPSSAASSTVVSPAPRRPHGSSTVSLPATSPLNDLASSLSSSRLGFASTRRRSASTSNSFGMASRLSLRLKLLHLPRRRSRRVRTRSSRPRRRRRRATIRRSTLWCVSISKSWNCLLTIAQEEVAQHKSNDDIWVAVGFALSTLSE